MGKDKKVVCHACGNVVTPIETSTTVMKHQDPWVLGFTLHKKSNKCPICGEKRIG
jgi:predicted RNA-binding Zn-ribbon protein involved in translation (DUF1610 family)